MTHETGDHPVKFRKKPVVIEAMQWDGDVRTGHPVTRWIRDNGGDYAWSPESEQKLVITTLEGGMTAKAGDFIIRGVQGEFYPCKPDIFRTTYEEALTDIEEN